MEHGNIEHLDIMWNDMSNKGSSAIATLLRVNRKLKYLNFKKNNLDTMGIGEIAAAIENNFVIQEVIYENNRIYTDSHDSLLIRNRGIKLQAGIDHSTVRKIITIFKYGDTTIYLKIIIQIILKNEYIYTISILNKNVPRVHLKLFWIFAKTKNTTKRVFNKILNMDIFKNTRYIYLLR